VRLQYDVYHAQRMEGNIVSTLRRLLPSIAHVQIADSPARGEPGTGELNYDYILDELATHGYNGYVGLEYRPSGTTLESFSWLSAGRGTPSPRATA
jgi:hydroxypyruvate isomerase